MPKHRHCHEILLVYINRDSNRWVGPVTIINFDKKIIITEFQQLDKHSSVHVIFVTEALELDVNLSDV